MRALLLVLAGAVLASCGEGVSGTPAPPPAPDRPPRQIIGLETVAPRTEIRIGQAVGPLVVYGVYDDDTTGTVTATLVSSDPGVVRIDDEGRAVGAGVGMAVVTASFEGFETELEFEVEDPIPRSVRDRPDDLSGPQIHFIYAVPSDIEDRNRDRFGELERSALALQAWVEEETGQRLRIDTFEGRPDVSFLRASFTHQEGDGTVGRTVADLLDDAQRLQLRGDKIPVFYYEGRVVGLCGSAYFGGGGAVYLDCSDAELGRDEFTVSTFEAVMVHEIFHVFGAVPECAPNFIEGWHVEDLNDDIMFAGTDRSPRGGVSYIDVGRDDYWGHGRSDCLDVSRSRFLEPVSGSALRAGSVEVRIPGPDWPLRCGVGR